MIGFVVTVIGIMGTLAWAIPPLEDRSVMNVEYSEPKNNGVMFISVGSHGYYIWDSRFNLCFFRSGSAIVQVNCTKLEIREVE